MSTTLSIVDVQGDFIRSCPHHLGLRRSATPWIAIGIAFLTASLTGLTHVAGFRSVPLGPVTPPLANLY